MPRIAFPLKLVISVYRSLSNVQRINVIGINFWISLFEIILGNTILSEMFEFWKVPLYFIIMGVHAYVHAT